MWRRGGGEEEARRRRGGGREGESEGGREPYILETLSFSVYHRLLKVICTYWNILLLTCRYSEAVEWMRVVSYRD